MAAAICEHWQFGLIVTGEGEEMRIERLFRSLSATGLCSFKVIRRIGQLRPIISPKQKLRIVGTRGAALRKDTELIGSSAWKYLRNNAGRFVLVIDDLEWDCHSRADKLFLRYRDALDSVLLKEEHRSRAAVHFLAIMLEAYFFADSKAINAVLGLNLSDYDGDVETIRNPKAKLSEIHPDYAEIKHGAEILGKVRAEYVLARADTCAYLRAMFDWCVAQLAKHPSVNSATIPDYRLGTGVMASATRNQ